MVYFASRKLDDQMDETYRRMGFNGMDASFLTRHSGAKVDV